MSGYSFVRRIAITLPLVGFVALATLFFFRLGAGDPSKLPSVLIGKPAPADPLPALDGLVRDNAPVPGLDPKTFHGNVTVVNVWASWCVPCRDEAAELMKLAEDKRFRIVGINYKDETENARRFLGRFGNPYAAVGVDKNGRAAIDWGVYGVPETFVVGREGKIVFKLVGPVTEGNLPALRQELEKVAGN
jgi:cytochrome c biogenesis protein CcmG/thiol:disulfide interchange protein DsbE